MDIITYSKVAKVSNEVDAMNVKTVMLYDGDTDGYYNLLNGNTIEYKAATSSAPFRCKKIEVEKWMKKISFYILSVLPASSSIFVAFSDANDAYISKNTNATGSQTLVIPANAKFIYFSFFGTSYCNQYSIIPYTDLSRITGADAVKTQGDTDGYYNLKNGSTIEIKPATFSAPFKCLKIEVEPWMKKINYNIISTLPSSAAIFVAFTNQNDEYISKNVNEVGEKTILIPTNAKYIYFSFFGTDYCGSYNIIPDMSIITTVNPYFGKKAVAFGTSLTYRSKTTGGFLQYLPVFSGLSFDNQGVGSSRIYGSATDSILHKIQAYTNYDDKDICLIEGFVNDWFNSCPLGEYTDDDDTTVCGCLRTAIKYVKLQNEKIKIFVILDHCGRQYGETDLSPDVVVNNFTQYQYYEECRRVCESMAIPVICQYKDSDISELTSSYYRDYIHLNNTKGAERSARTIWAVMKTYDPN